MLSGGGVVVNVLFVRVSPITHHMSTATNVTMTTPPAGARGGWGNTHNHTHTVTHTHTHMTYEVLRAAPQRTWTPAAGQAHWQVPPTPLRNTHTHTHATQHYATGRCHLATHTNDTRKQTAHTTYTQNPTPHTGEPTLAATAMGSKYLTITPNQPPPPPHTHDASWWRVCGGIVTTSADTSTPRR